MMRKTVASSPISWPAAVLFTAVVILAAGCSPRVRPVLTFSGETMGTVYTVKVVEPPESFDPVSVEREIEQVLNEINVLMSTYQSDSELSRFNRSDSKQWFTISPQTAEVIDEAVRIGQLTDGAFDVTIGPLVDLWNFGPEKAAEDAVPTDEEIDRAKDRAGLDKIEVRLAPPAVRKKRADLQVDLSGIAKGFAVDRLAERLDAAGAENYMVEVGGEVRARGHNRHGKPWQIAVESPVADTRTVRRVVPLENIAMATSGDYRNYFEKGGVRYCHIIDPRTGKPVSHRLASVTVLAPECAQADALATALMVLGPEAGYDLALREGLSCLFIIKESAGFVEKTTPGFDDLLQYNKGCPSGEYYGSLYSGRRHFRPRLPQHVDRHVVGRTLPDVFLQGRQTHHGPELRRRLCRPGRRRQPCPARTTAQFRQHQRPDRSPQDVGNVSGAVRRDHRSRLYDAIQNPAFASAA